jgi:hypothetical protein
MKELNKTKKWMKERKQASTVIYCINLHSSHHLENFLSYISFQPHFAWVDRTDIEMTMVVCMKSSMFPVFFFPLSFYNQQKVEWDYYVFPSGLYAPIKTNIEVKQKMKSLAYGRKER